MKYQLWNYEHRKRNIETMINGTVTLSLAEVDTLRNEIKAGQDKVAALNTELTEVRADRRVLKITVSEPNQLSPHATSVDLPSLYRVIERNRQTGHMYRDEVCRQVLSCIEFHHAILKREDKKEFINMDDVVSAARANAEEGVKWELNESRRAKEYAEQKLTELQEKHTRDITLAVNPINMEVSRLTAMVADRNEEIEALREGRERITEVADLQWQIRELAEELVTERAKKWYQKL